MSELSHACFAPVRVFLHDRQPGMPCDFGSAFPVGQGCVQWDELPGTQEDEEPTALMHELRLGIHGVDIWLSPSLHGQVIDRPAIWCKSQPVPSDLAHRARWPRLLAGR